MYTITSRRAKPAELLPYIDAALKFSGKTIAIALKMKVNEYIALENEVYNLDKKATVIEKIFFTGLNKYAKGSRLKYVLTEEGQKVGKSLREIYVTYLANFEKLLECYGEVEIFLTGLIKKLKTFKTDDAVELATKLNELFPRKLETDVGGALRALDLMFNEKESSEEREQQGVWYWFYLKQPQFN